jgi:hypothetical protein
MDVVVATDGRVRIVVGFHFYDLFFCGWVIALWLVPVALGFFWIMPDADRRGQPGLIWAVATIPLGWLAVLGYLIVRALLPSRP